MKICVYSYLSVVKKQWKPLMNTETDYCRTPSRTPPSKLEDYFLCELISFAS